MTDIERIELTHATIHENISAVAIHGLRFGKGCKFQSLSELLQEFGDYDVTVQEIICISDLEADTDDVFVSFSSEYLDSVSSHLKRNFQNRDCSFSIEDRILQLRITGSGFARSHEFLQNIYSNISNQNVNILAQTCSDLEVIVFCEKAGSERSIPQAMNSIGLRYEWCH